jgi:uncharacterized protein (TIGR02246 family)
MVHDPAWAELLFRKGGNMAHKMITASLLTISLLAGGCQRYEHGAGNGAANTNTTGDADSAKDAIKAVEANMTKAGEAKDSAALASSYASDAVFAIPGRTVHGSDAIGKSLASDLQDPAFKFESTNERTDTSGDLGYTTGSYKVTYTDSKTKKVVNGTGSYLTVFRKQPDGSWKAVADFSTPGS